MTDTLSGLRECLYCSVSLGDKGMRTSVAGVFLRGAYGRGGGFSGGGGVGKSGGTTGWLVVVGLSSAERTCKGDNEMGVSRWDTGEREGR